MATHSSILAWRIPWMEEPSGLQSMGLQRVGHDWVPNTYPSCLPVSLSSRISTGLPQWWAQFLLPSSQHPLVVLLLQALARACLLPSHCSVTSDCIALSCTLLFSRSVMSHSLQPHGLQHARLPSSSPSPGACSNSCPLSQWCHPTISASVIAFSSSPQSFPASGSFPMSQLKWPNYCMSGAY